MSGPMSGSMSGSMSVSESAGFSSDPHGNRGACPGYSRKSLRIRGACPGFPGGQKKKVTWSFRGAPCQAPERGLHVRVPPARQKRKVTWSFWGGSMSGSMSVSGKGAPCQLRTGVRKEKLHGAFGGLHVRLHVSIPVKKGGSMSPCPPRSKKKSDMELLGGSMSSSMSEKGAPCQIDTGSSEKKKSAPPHGKGSMSYIYIYMTW